MKILRAFAVTVMLACPALSALAQEVKDKCEESFTAYEAVIKDYHYTEAEPMYIKLVKDCPRYDAKVYTYGEKLYKVKLESAQNADEKKAALDSIMNLYAAYEKNFPGNGSVVRKALLMKEQKLAKDDEVYKMLDGFYTSNKQKFTDYDALQEYFMLYLAQYEAKDKGVNQEQFVNKYADVAAHIAYVQANLTKQKTELLLKKETEPLTDEEKIALQDAGVNTESLNAVKDNISIMASKHFSCEILSEYYAKDFEKNKDNTAWLEAVANVMYDNKCYRSDILNKAATIIYEQRHDAASAYRMGEIMLKSAKPDQAIRYFEESAVKEEVSQVKAKRYYDIAVIYRNSNKAKAKEYARRAAIADKEWGTPYLFIAEMLSSVTTNDCGMNEFQRKALLFLASDYAQKAAAAEVKYQPTAEALVKQYSERYPTKAEAKDAGYKKGGELQYGCWINETVKIPKL